MRSHRLLLFLFFSEILSDLPLSAKQQENSQQQTVPETRAREKKKKKKKKKHTLINYYTNTLFSCINVITTFVILFPLSPFFTNLAT
jgi:hypothetical protein